MHPPPLSRRSPRCSIPLPLLPPPHTTPTPQHPTHVSNHTQHSQPRTRHLTQHTETPAAAACLLHTPQHPLPHTQHITRHSGAHTPLHTCPTQAAAHTAVHTLAYTVGITQRCKVAHDSNMRTCTGTSQEQSHIHNRSLPLPNNLAATAQSRTPVRTHTPTHLPTRARTSSSHTRSTPASPTCTANSVAAHSSVWLPP